MTKSSKPSPALRKIAPWGPLPAGVVLNFNFHSKPGGDRFRNPHAPVGASNSVDAMWDAAEARVKIKKMIADPSADLITCLLGSHDYSEDSAKLLVDLLPLESLEGSSRVAAIRELLSSMWHRPADVLLERVIQACKIGAYLSIFARTEAIKLVRDEPDLLRIRILRPKELQRLDPGGGYLDIAALVDTMNAVGSDVPAYPSWIQLAALQLATYELSMELERELGCGNLTIEFMNGLFIGRKGIGLMMRCYLVALSRATQKFGFDPLTQKPTNFMHLRDMFALLLLGQTVSGGNLSPLHSWSL